MEKNEGGKGRVGVARQMTEEEGILLNSKTIEVWNYERHITWVLASPWRPKLLGSSSVEGEEEREKLRLDRD